MEKRVQALQRLRTAILDSEAEINAALKADLGKSGFESYMCEVGLTCSEISYMIRHTRRFAAERRVTTPLAQFHARSYVKPSPYGVVLIMSPWNYPFMLTMDPLADALAAGNTVVLKPSAYSPHTSAVIEKIISSCFDPSYVAVISGGREENQCLLREAFDYIFFTGSQAVGREVLRQAAEHLTPVTLELGGKSPCIVDRTANIPLAAKRIVFGKFLNCGQTCVAPDYLYCEASVKDRLVQAIGKEIRAQFGERPLDNENYGKIINQKHFRRLAGLIDREKVVFGGGLEEDRCRIEPTVMDNVTWEDPVMGEEIFGPILPVLTFQTLEEAAAQVCHQPVPVRRRLRQRHHHPLGHQRHGFRRRGGQRHGGLPREGGLRHLLPPQEHRGQEDLAGPSHALPALPALQGEAGPYVPEIKAVTSRRPAKAGRLHL